MFKLDRVEMLRSAVIDFEMYADNHDGTYPANLTVFANAVSVKEPTGSEYRRPDWESFYYVTGLTTNDPPEMPLIIYMSKKWLVPGGTFMFRDGGGMWVSTEIVQRLIREPWEITLDGRSLDDQTKENLKKRVKVLPPIGVASPQ